LFRNIFSVLLEFYFNQFKEHQESKEKKKKKKKGEKPTLEAYTLCSPFSTISDTKAFWQDIQHTVVP